MSKLGHCIITWRSRKERLLEVGMSEKAIELPPYHYPIQSLSAASKVAVSTTKLRVHTRTHYVSFSLDPADEEFQWLVLRLIYDILIALCMRLPNCKRTNKSRSPHLTGRRALHLIGYLFACRSLICKSSPQHSFTNPNFLFPFAYGTLSA